MVIGPKNSRKRMYVEYIVKEKLETYTNTISSLTLAIPEWASKGTITGIKAHITSHKEKNTDNRTKTGLEAGLSTANKEHTNHPITPKPKRKK